MRGLLFRMVCFKIQMQYVYKRKGSLSPCRSVLTEGKEVCHRAEAFSKKVRKFVTVPKRSCRRKGSIVKSVIKHAIPGFIRMSIFKTFWISLPLPPPHRLQEEYQSRNQKPETFHYPATTRPSKEADIPLKGRAPFLNFKLFKITSAFKMETFLLLYRKTRCFIQVSNEKL